MIRARSVFAAFILSFWAVSAAGFRVPTPETFVLSNGARVLFVKDSSVPLVAVRGAMVSAGSAADSFDKEGVADLAARLSMRGNDRMTAEETAEELDFMGAKMDFWAMPEYAAIQVDCLKEYFPRLMEIMVRNLSSPTLVDDEFRKERDRAVQSAKSVKDDPQSALQQYFQRAYFGDHPLGRITAGTELSLRGLEAGHVRAFHSARYRPDRLVLAVVGDLDTQSLRRVMDDTLGRWERPATQAIEAAVPPFQPPRGRRLLLVDKPDSAQSYFVLGGPGPAMGDPESPPIQVMDTLFGGRFTSWLNSELRIKRGLTYGAGSEIRRWRGTGVYAISSYTENAKIGEMLDVTLGLMKKAREQGFSDSESASAVTYVRGQYPPRFEDPPDLAAALCDVELYGLGDGYHQKFFQSVKDVRRPKVMESARRLIPEDDFTLVVVGAADSVRPILAKYGKFQEKRVSDPGY